MSLESLMLLRARTTLAPSAPTVGETVCEKNVPLTLAIAGSDSWNRLGPEEFFAQHRDGVGADVPWWRCGGCW
jgi:hypothetical protein